MTQFTVEIDYDDYRAKMTCDAMTHIIGRLLEEQAGVEDKATYDYLNRYWVALTNLHIKIAAAAKEAGVEGV
jgi:hypothetical protein